MKTTFKMKATKGVAAVVSVLVGLSISIGSANADIHHTATVFADVAVVDNDSALSFTRRGTGLLRSGAGDNALQLQQVGLEYQADLSSHWSFQANLHYFDDIDRTPGFTQAFLRYAPLPKYGYRVRARAGFFYPEMSLTNTDVGWNNRMFITNSAINSWIGEELRIAGAEVSITRPGRRFRSPMTYSLVASTFKGNDPLGSVLAWRGWGLHNRQLGLTEHIPLADYSGLSQGPLVRQSRDIEPFKEIDGRFGYYLGAKMKYLSHWQLGFLHYDNNGDPRAFNQGQWAWDTLFNHWSLTYRKGHWRLLAQHLSGMTTLGGRVVVIDYQSSYVAGQYQWDKHSLALRYDDFETLDRDGRPFDNNNGSGHAWTLSYQHQWSQHVNVGIEWLGLNSAQVNRTTLTGQPQLTQQQWQARIRLRW